MATRLDRLVLLLDTGSTYAVRLTAAQQIGEVQRQHPDDLYHLLARVLVHLRSKEWETRIAAGHAIEHIARNVPQWDPPPPVPSSSSSAASSEPQADSSDHDTGLYTFSHFDIENVVKNGLPLLASAGEEFDLDTADMDPKERVAAQKKMLKQRLGLGTDFMDVDFFEESDIAVSKGHGAHPTPHAPAPQPPQQHARQLLDSSMKGLSKMKDEPEDVNMAGLSPRERNMLKRKAKVAAKDKGKDKVRVVDLSSSSSMKKRKSTFDEKPIPASIKLEGESATDSTPTAGGNSGVDSPKVVIEHTPKDPTAESLSLGVYGSGDEWPFEGLCEKLCLDLFSPLWEIRHGSALGLSKLLKVHSSGAGKLVGLTPQANASRHAAWMEDVAIHLLCVLALDRFADFVGDSVVVPVRETCAQALGVLVQGCDRELALKIVHEGLLRLVEGSVGKLERSTGVDGVRGGRWEVRHAALIGLKYWMAVRKDLVQDVLVPKPGERETGAFRAIINGLKDHDDDVRAVSSSTLLPICDLVVTLLPIETVFHNIFMNLWDCLQELDDLTSATASVMDLLSHLIMKPQVAAAMLQYPQAGLDVLVPRMYPFFRHAILSVRVAVLKTISTLVDVDMQNPQGGPVRWVTIELLRLAFQNFVVEERAEVVERTLEVWSKLIALLERGDTGRDLKSMVLREHPTSALATWFALIMTPVGNPLDLRLFYHYTPGGAAPVQTAGKKRGSQQRGSASISDGLNVSPHDKAMALQDMTVVSREDIMRGRLAGATGLGQLVCALMTRGDAEAETRVRELITAYLQSQWIGHRVFCNVMIDEWAGRWEETRPDGPLLIDAVPLAKSAWENMVVTLVQADSGVVLLFAELVAPLANVRAECEALLQAFKDYGVGGIPSLPPIQGGGAQQQQQQEVSPFGPTFTLQVVDHVISTVVPQLMPRVPAGLSQRATKLQPSPPTRHALILEKQSRVVASVTTFREIQTKLETQAMATMSSAVVRLGSIPPKLNPIIRALMDGVKHETNEDLQERAAKGIGRLLELNIKSGKPAAVNDKVTKNLGGFLCSDLDLVGDAVTVKDVEGILTLKKGDAGGEGLAENGIKNGTSASTAAKAGKKRNSVAVPGDADISPLGMDFSGAGDVVQKERSARMVLVRGAQAALRNIFERFGPKVFEVIPRTWELMAGALTNLSDPAAAFDKAQKDSGYAQDICDALFILSRLAPHIHPSLHSQIIGLLPAVCTCLRAPLSVIRYAAARCMASFCRVVTVPAMKIVIDQVLHSMGDSTSVTNRQGAAECVYHIVQVMDMDVLPYLVFLVVPVLGRMSDPDEGVRFMSTSVFASLVKLMPLESGAKDPEGFTPEMVKQKVEERKFIGQLIGSERVQEFELPVKISAELRPYQKEGVSWLAFLNRYGLHGILCDDMGLGKTLQSICMLASDHHNRAEKFAQTGAPDCAHAPSVVVCPPTLTGHWVHEIETYAPFMKAMVYGGIPVERAELRSKIPAHDVIVMSYDILRNDIEELGRFRFNYCILDEGHVIKNPKTKLTKAVKSVQAMHRLILSGTPIQNNVLELWSLFDYLMPGFLGTERQFSERFGKPILASRDAKSSSREQEAGALAMEALHKQVLPFLMRRMKEDVLHDLPPKIIQDYYCELSDLQKTLYEDFAKSEAKEGAETVLLGEEEGKAGAKKGKGGGHVFQALQYLRKLCNHPSLVLTPKHPRYEKVMKKLQSDGSSLRDVKNAPKIDALRQLLMDCGIGAESADPTTAAVAPHRALVFAQLRPMLDIIEHDLFKTLMPSVSYLRLDGQTDAKQRHDLVRKFNEDPSIDVLLLTTHVGGLGLTLTGADTVIFVEHDWNPMKDLQAMDRAHRIGQKRVVNVYRLITRGTLEEKIMGLQKFKLNIASSVINQENAGLKSMDTDQIIDLFTLGDDGKKDKKKEAAKNKKASAKEVLDELGDVWEEKEYDEFAVDEFLNGLNLDER
ncbi:btaf1 RNA polymerase II, B-TFIID transcription factor-associated, 170kDa [Borealophlyctis nickersoniae]|nr:btaf1 RNA polymerase II, B-TFIID transcription factor-associated, 170kDa [Borealophlyctis nickersoniae]